jgi:50S ribosomal protein L16 3-hydroxylase
VFELGEVSAKRFFAEYWRRKPLFLKGGARLLLERSVPIAEFRMLCDRLERDRPKAVIRKTGCIFAERIDEVSPELRRIAQAQKHRLSCRDVWFDGAYAIGGDSLGSHYDKSDCFVLQQVGTERWRLCPPETLPPKELRARMLDKSDGLVHMPDECHEYVVEEGDLLYVPLFWGHWAVSEGGPSLTLSMVLGANNALELLLPALTHVLSEERAWWYPLPQVPLEGGEQQATPPALLEQYFDVLLESFAKPEFAARAKSIWWRDAYLPPRPELEAPRRDTSAPRKKPEDVGLNPLSIARLVGSQIPPPDPEAAAAPGDDAALALRLLLARRVMGDLFEIALSSREMFSESPASAAVLHIAWALQHAELETIAPYVARPEVTSWLWRMSEALAFKQMSYFEEIASPATRLFFPALLTVRAHLRGSTLPIGRSHERGINLLSVRRRITSPVPLGTRMNVLVLGPLLRFSSAAGTMVEFPSDTITERGTVDVGSGFYVEDLPMTKETEIAVLDRDAWIFGQYPRGGRFGARPLAESPVPSLLETVDRHARAIEQAWPELAKDLARLISLALPLSGRDARAQSAPPFLGAVALTENARPADLVAELGRTKARLIASVGLAFDRPYRVEARERFEDAVANAYRRAFEELAGLEISAEARPFTEALSPWGRAFMDAVFALMK